MSAALAPLAGPSRTTCRSLSNIAASSISRLPSAPLRRPRHLHTFPPLASHENPLGLPRNTDRLPPKMPQRSRGGPPAKRPVPNVKHVLAVSSCKGGVGKSTVAANLALSLLNNPPEGSERRPRVGLLDLDIFGPSVPKLLGLEQAGEAELTEGGALLPLTNHGLPTMSMTYLLGPEKASNPIVWRGLMVQKAVQQLLFDVDWRSTPSDPASAGLDVLVIDMPPGTGDVALTLTQLVQLSGAVIVSTPQEVALEDTRKGVAMFDKVGVKATGLVLNMTHYMPPPPLPQDPLPLFGPSEPFDKLAKSLGLPVLGRLPVEPAVSYGGDAGWPVVLKSDQEGGETKRVFKKMAEVVWAALREKA